MLGNIQRLTIEPIFNVQLPHSFDLRRARRLSLCLIGMLVAVCLTIGNVGFAASPDSITNDQGDQAELAKLLDHAEGLRREGEAAEAAGVYRQALTLAERAFGPDHTLVAVVLNGME